MEWRHLRTKNGVALLLHILGKEGSLVLLGTNLSSVLLLGTHTDSGEERTDTDSSGAEVIYLVNL